MEQNSATTVHLCTLARERVSVSLGRARLCEWNGTEVLDTGQLMEMLNICFTTNLGDQQVVIAI